MNNKYYESVTLLQNTKDGYNTIQEIQEKLWKDYQANIIDSITYNNEYKEHTNKQQTLDTMTQILLNNLLHIQQQLLKELLEIYKSKYIKARIGEKTKEKIQNHFNSYIKDNYNIDVYSYITIHNNYKDESEIQISMYYNDMYYQYELRQEKIIYNKETNESYLYYYNDVDFTNIDDVETKAIELRKQYNDSMNKIKELKKQIEQIKDENNKNNKCCLTFTRITSKDY